MTYTPEFSRPLAIEGIIPDKVRTEKIAASADECAALAARFGIREISDFKAEIYIRRVIGGEVVKVEGKLAADVVQACVVSLQDVHEHVEASFETYFTEDKDKAADEDDPEDDAPEMAENGIVDLGEVAAQYLALELNPYPRAPGVSLAAQMAEVGTAAKPNPFAVLEVLKEGKDKGKKD